MGDRPVAVAAQPRWWAIIWWRPQSSAALSTLVWPPSTQWMMSSASA
ncbi:MAG: hypothetical protein H7270_13975 [Dermatophilaceae bacterium]|nr:hypothetical protein [Dermatophilaceae bacterium]